MDEGRLPRSLRVAGYDRLCDGRVLFEREAPSGAHHLRICPFPPVVRHSGEHASGLDDGGAQGTGRDLRDAVEDGKCGFHARARRSVGTIATRSGRHDLGRWRRFGRQQRPTPAYVGAQSDLIVGCPPQSSSGGEFGFQRSTQREQLLDASLVSFDEEPEGENEVRRVRFANERPAPMADLDQPEIGEAAQGIPQRGARDTEAAHQVALGR